MGEMAASGKKKHSDYTMLALQVVRNDLRGSQTINRQHDLKVQRPPQTNNVTMYALPAVYH